MEFYGVFITTSSIPNAGKGLWAKRHFSKGETILPFYGGEQLTKKQVDERYGAGNTTLAPYVIKLTDNSYRDAAVVRSPASFINDVYNSDKKINAEFILNERENEVSVVATCDIRPFTEIFASYGLEYWK
jgi:hypothetical protein